MQRFKTLEKSSMTEAQRKAFEDIAAGPRGGVRGPFNALLRSPLLAERAQKLGEYARYDSSLPARLNELAILITARHWSAQYEWFAHHKLALQAGLAPQIAADIAAGRTPAGLPAEEAAVYAFCSELHRDKAVSDTSYAAVLGLFGERGVVDLIGVCGYYTLVSMVLNVDRYPLPEGTPAPLAPLP